MAPLVSVFLGHNELPAGGCGRHLTGILASSQTLFTGVASWTMMKAQVTRSNCSVYLEWLVHDLPAVAEGARAGNT